MSKDFIPSVDVQRETSTPSLKPAKLISRKQAVDYYNNFYHTRIATGYLDDNRAVWFSIEQLENYFEKVNALCAEKAIEITRFVFLLAAKENGERTVVLAPATYDEQLDLHRAFSLDNGKVTYLHRFAGEDYSTIKEYTGLHSLDESLLLSNEGYISSATAVQWYNNYFDTVTGPFTAVLKGDTRFVWYEKGEFEEYLSYVKENSSNSVGINVIFGVKDNNELEGIYANRITLFFAPDTSKTSIGLNMIRNKWEHVISSKEEEKITCYFNRGNSAPPPFHWD